MKPQRFEIGQAVTPKGKEYLNPFNLPVPKFGEIYHVSKFDSELCSCNCGLQYVHLREFSHGICQTRLEPVITTSELESLLQEEPEKQTIEI